MAEHDDNKQLTRKSGVAYGAVFTLASAIVVCLLVGWALDRWLKTEPWLLVAGIIIGAVLGFYEFIRMLSRAT